MKRFTAADAEALRADFPQLAPGAQPEPLVYLDSAATSLKPQAVVDRISRFYAIEYGTVRRGAYALSRRSTAFYEDARRTAARWLGAADEHEIVYTRGTTEGINLVANAWGGANLREGDVILITELEHHANIVPWQLIAARTGAKLRVAPIDDNAEVKLDEWRKLLDDNVKIASFVHVSNALGTINPIKEMIAAAKSVGAITLVDAAQSAAHQRLEVAELGCDFAVCSGHKMYGPTGVGLLYGRAEVLEAMPPWVGGGDMVDKVTFEETTYEDPPWRFEAGTPPFAQVIGLAAAIEWLESQDIEALGAWEYELAEKTRRELSKIDGVRVLGNASKRAGIVSFVIDGLHSFDVGTILDQEGVAVRVGHHCAQPVLKRLGVSSTIRASFAAYNNENDVDALLSALQTTMELLR